MLDEAQLSAFDIERINLEVLLYQAGYLTVDEVKQVEDTIFYTLKIPNLEVKSSFNKVILSSLMDDGSMGSILRRDMLIALQRPDLEGFKAALAALFSSLPYQNYVNNNIYLYEGFYASVVYAFLASLAVPLIGEDTTNRGRIDLSLQMESTVYIIEFKVGTGDALKQIKEKKYCEKYRNRQKTIYAVGIIFDEKERNIADVQWEKM